jgi:hypothetical protein
MMAPWLNPTSAVAAWPRPLCCCQYSTAATKRGKASATRCKRFSSVTLAPKTTENPGPGHCIRPGHADNQRLRKAFAQITPHLGHAVRAGTHAMEQQHQLHRAGRLLNHDVVAHVFSPELLARLDGAPVLNDGRAMGRVRTE